ncbi:hypothetical protein MAR_002530, partial [Mya arenaria]
MDNIEINLENSLTDLKKQLAEGLERIAKTQKNYEPKLGGITKNIQSTISNTVTQMVKTHFIAISTSMKREKLALRNLKTEMNKHIKAIDDDFQSIQRTLEVRFLNQSITIEEHIRAQKENVSDVMIETNTHANQLKIDFENAQSSLVERFTNQAKALDYKFERQSDDIGELISDKTLNEDLETMQSEVNLRFTNQEDLITSLNSTISSTEGSLQDYKSSCDSIRADLSSLDYRFENQSDAMGVVQTNQKIKISSLNSRMSSTEGHLQSYKSSAFVDCSEIRKKIGGVPSGVYHITTWKTNKNASLKLMHEMTSRTTHDLRIDITRANDSSAYIVYADISVGAGSDYTLHVGNARSESG